MDMERLQKILAHAGVASRRKCEELILAGRVTVNGEIVRELGAKADPAADEILVDGRPLRKESKFVILFNKPKGVISSVSDPQGRKVVTDYLRDVKQRVYPVGRLDYDTEGLLLLTNDGELTQLLTHPRHQVPKTYHVTVKGVVHGDDLDKLREGILLEDGMTEPAEVEYVDVDLDNRRSVVSITITEGRNRQVRRMFEALHLPVERLRRVQLGPLTLAGVPRGKYRILHPQEVEQLREYARRSHKIQKAKTDEA